MDSTWIYVIALCFHIPLASGTFTGNMGTLHNALLQNRGTYRPTQTVTVDVSFALSTVYDVDLYNGYATLSGIFVASWTDSTLAWTPSSFGNIDELYAGTDQLWKPPLHVDNRLVMSGLLGSDDDLIKVTDAGLNTWETGGSFTVKCDANGDTSITCALVVSCLSYGDNAVLLSQYSPAINMDSLHVDPSIALQRHSATTATTRDPRGQTSKTSLKFEFVIEKAYRSSQWNLIVPFILVSCLNLFVFLGLTEVSDKLGFTVNILLATVLYLVLVSTQLRLDGGKVSTVETMMFVLLLCQLSELLSTFFVASYISKSDRGAILPHSTQSFARKMLAKLSCVCCCSLKPLMDNQIRPDTSDHYPGRFDMPKNTRVSSAALKRNRQDGEFSRIKSATSTASYNSRSPASVGSPTSSCTDSTAALHGGPVSYTWSDIAAMWDRLFFILFFLIRLVILVVFISMQTAECGLVFCVD